MSNSVGWGSKSAPETSNTVVWMSSTYHFPKDANERGFVPEKDENGRPTGRLLDSGNWTRRRKQRYEAIRRGLISVKEV